MHYIKFSLSLLGVFVLCILNAHARELHVSINGSDKNAGSSSSPFRTISAAARIARAGDTITVHKGTYRERVDPFYGGTSDVNRIVYRAAEGDRVEIKGSEIIKGWQKAGKGVWKVTLDNSFFGDYNPYIEIIHGDWFKDLGRIHHTGEVYLNGKAFYEIDSLEKVFNPERLERAQDQIGSLNQWFCKNGGKSTTIWANFHGSDPNKELVEINVRPTVFYPKKTGINYITVQGFIIEQAATNWAPPTAEQIGLIGPHWSKGWIIENNTIRNSPCCGISLGKYGDEFDNKSKNSSAGYVETVKRALATGWNKETVGSHIVRNNIIHDCEQAGIVGSLGAIFSTISGNEIYNIHIRRQFSGFEMAAIKIHGAIDMLISHNHIYNNSRGLWLDWMAQGTRITGNLFHDNATEKNLTDWDAGTPGGQNDMFVEVNHGPFLVDNNCFLSLYSVNNRSQGGAYIHNLFAGRIRIVQGDDRETPFLKPHSTQIVGLHDNPWGDDRYYNNIFVQYGDLSGYDSAKLRVSIADNVYLMGAKPCIQDQNAKLHPDFNPMLKLQKNTDGWWLEMNIDSLWYSIKGRKLVTTELLGKAAISGMPFEMTDGSLVTIDTDFIGEKRSKIDPSAGPFEHLKQNHNKLKVW